MQLNEVGFLARLGIPTVTSKKRRRRRDEVWRQSIDLLQSIRGTAPVREVASQPAAPAPIHAEEARQAARRFAEMVAAHGGLSGGLRSAIVPATGGGKAESLPSETIPDPAEQRRLAEQAHQALTLSRDESWNYV